MMRTMENGSQLKLVRPAAAYEAGFLEMLSAYRALGGEKYREEYNDPAFDFESYIKRLEKYSWGENLPRYWVQTSTFWLTDSVAVLGTARLRHGLNDRLQKNGGNIGFDIHPLRRGKGYGNEILRLMLLEAGKIGLTRVLLSCDRDNIASRKIIEKHGGVFDGENLINETGEIVLRFWIQIPDSTD
jgi:predicted acetyltransferase